MWRIKVLIQFILARIPFGERLNYLLTLLRRPNIHKVETIRKHIPAYLQTLATIKSHKELSGATVLEVGTGWCPIAPLLFYTAGAHSIITLDHVPHLRWKPSRNALQACIDSASAIAETLSLPIDLVHQRLARLSGATDLESLLRLANIDYRAPADGQHLSLNTASVDVWYTYSVLENIPVDIVSGIFKEARRVLKGDAVWFSVIGCQDPFASGTPDGRINYLRYSEQKWHFWTGNSIAYNNRLRERDFHQLLTAHGFRILWSHGLTDKADMALLSNLTVDSKFAGYTIDELAVYRAEILAAPNPLAES